MAPKPQNTPDSTPSRPASDDRGRDLMDWLQVNSKLLTGAATVIAVAAVGYWFYIKNQQIKTVNAERSLMQAQQSLQSGNTALATSDLQRVVSRYKGTGAGTEAAMLLAQAYYNAGKYQEGIKVLKEVSGKAGGSEASLQSLMGDGYSQLNKPTEAAKAYERAASTAEFATEKAYYRAKAARSYTSASNTTEAKRLWSELATDEKAASVAAEAKVRLAELDAKRAGKS